MYAGVCAYVKERAYEKGLVSLWCLILAKRLLMQDHFNKSIELDTVFVWLSSLLINC